MKTTALKFGGSSLADANQFAKVASIIRSHEGRTFVVASAPGKRFKDDVKVTDMLYRCHALALEKKPFDDVLSSIRMRFEEIASALGADFDVQAEFSAIRAHLEGCPEKDYMASRGEYLNSRLLASYLGYEFIDPECCVFFDEQGRLDSEKTDRALGALLEGKDHAVIAGFYGCGADGKIKTFSRGGSDVTGAIVARAAKADIYENWTDVSGMLCADPRIVDSPKPIREISYMELRELSYMGASVMHEDAVFPVRLAGIPINIRNTNRPEDAGTMIVPERSLSGAEGDIVTGIAGIRGFSSIRIEKAMLNNEVGYVARLLNIIASAGVSFDHVPTGIDSISVVVDTGEFMRNRTWILGQIEEHLKPDSVVIEDGLALVAVVGMGMAYRKGVAAKLFSALAEADVNIRMIDQGSSEINIIVGIDESDYEKAVNALYMAFFG